MHRTMYEEESYEPFNPFAVGPPGYGKRLDCKLPDYPTYPPPLYAKLPPPPVHANRSVSQGTLLKASIASDAKSQIGEVSISKAINDEMAASKKSVGELDERIDAGGISKTTLHSRTKSKASSGSIKTLLAAATLSKAPSASSLHSNVSTATKFSKASGMSIKSKASERLSRANASNTTLKSKSAKSTASAASAATLKSKSAKSTATAATLKSKLSATKSGISALSTEHPLGKAPKAADIARQQAEVSELAKLCAEQSDRLKAGIEHCYNRYSSLTQPYSYTNKEVEHKSPDDRMQHWCNNAAL